MALAHATAQTTGAHVDDHRLSRFEAEVLETLVIEGRVECDPSGERTLCEQFGYANDRAEVLHRALRQLIKLGLVRQLDGQRNAMRNNKRLRFSKRSGTAYEAV